MIKSGATVDAKDNYGYTSLSKAIRYGHAEAVALLLAAGADFELVSRIRSWNNVMTSETSLEIACRHSRIECVTLLLDYGVSIKDDMNCYRPYHHYREIHDCRPMLLEEKEHRLRRVVFDSFITHYIEYTPLINKIYSTCFPSGNIRTAQPPVGWIRADAVRNKYYLDEVFFYLHLHVADVHTKKLSSMSSSSSSSRGFTELACNSDDTSTIMAVLTDRLKLYLQV